MNFFRYMRAHYGLDALDTDAFAGARAQIEGLERAAKAIAARVPLGQARPGSVRLTNERKRIHDAIRMATYNAESALARLFGPHYARSDDEARTLLREAFAAPADLEVVGNELTATKTVYPGTEFTIVFSVKGDR
jgi:hypothetical protein